jgi:protein gp37
MNWGGKDKKHAGRTVDGQAWDEFPGSAAIAIA